VERQTQDLPKFVLLVVAPTRVLFDSDFMKRRGVTIIPWSWFFLLLNFVFLFTFLFLKRHWWPWQLLVWALPFSRIGEIVYAFYNDSVDRMEGQNSKTGLSRVDRFKLLGRSYCEIAICYASLYLALSPNSFDAPLTNGLQSLYFSWITITTTGYGDIKPLSGLAKCLCMTEVAFGLMLLVFAVGTYFSYRREEDSHTTAAKNRSNTDTKEEATKGNTSIREELMPASERDVTSHAAVKDIDRRSASLRDKS
jgi:hypothetical protein